MAMQNSNNQKGKCQMIALFKGLEIRTYMYMYCDKVRHCSYIHVRSFI